MSPAALVSTWSTGFAASASKLTPRWTRFLVPRGSLVEKTLIFLVMLGSSMVSAEEPPLILGVHPYLQADELHRRFRPLADFLAGELGRECLIRVAIDYRDHIKVIGEDGLDIAYLGPASYVELTRLYGRKPILARLEAGGSPTYRGYIVVRGDSAIEGLGDLKDKRFAFGDPNSTMGTLVPRYLLLDAGIGLDDLAGYRYLSGHKNVALAVLAGDADAGSLKEEVYDQYRSKALRVLTPTPPIAEHLFVTRADMDSAVVRRLRELMLGLRGAGLVERVLSPIKKNVTALVPAADGDYDNLRRIVARVKASSGSLEVSRQ